MEAVSVGKKKSPLRMNKYNEHLRLMWVVHGERISKKYLSTGSIPTPRIKYVLVKIRSWQSNELYILFLIKSEIIVYFVSAFAKSCML